jgi:micrococcal nuclease
MRYTQTHEGVLGLPYSNVVLLSVLGAVAALGSAGYGGYVVYKKVGSYAGDFETRRHTVSRVIDGDTFTVCKGEGRGTKKEMSGGCDDAGEVKVRMIGINAPEMKECGGVEAKDALSRKLAGQEIELRKNLNAVDDHERLLRYAVIASDDPTDDVRLVSQELLLEGVVYLQDEPDNDMYRDAHRKAENAAEEAGRGVWGMCKKEVKARRAGIAHEESALREEDNAPHKTGCDIKGNVSEKGYGKIYFTPTCPNYKSIKVDARKGEEYFCTEAEAKKKGKN